MAISILHLDSCVHKCAHAYTRDNLQIYSEYLDQRLFYFLLWVILNYSNFYNKYILILELETKILKGLKTIIIFEREMLFYQPENFSFHYYYSCLSMVFISACIPLYVYVYVCVVCVHELQLIVNCSIETALTNPFPIAMFLVNHSIACKRQRRSPWIDIL